MAAHDDDIDRLILELHSTSAPSRGTGDVTRLERWSRLVAGRGGSDLLLVAGLRRPFALTAVCSLSPDGAACAAISSVVLLVHALLRLSAR